MELERLNIEVQIAGTFVKDKFIVLKRNDNEKDYPFENAQYILTLICKDGDGRQN